MRRSPGIGHEPGLTRLAVSSFVLHIILISVLIIPFSSGEKEFRSYHVNLVEPVPVREGGKSAVTRKARRRVPPKKTLVKKKKITKKKALPSKESIKKKSQPDRDDTRISTEKIAKEIERLRAIKALSKIKEGQDRTREIEVVRKRISESSITGPGIPGKGKSLDHDSYYALITRKIWSEWIYPDIDAAGLEVIISIKIDSDGKVLSQVVEKTSGNMLFDRSAGKAISKASPLPPPHREMEIGVRFYL